MFHTLFFLISTGTYPIMLSTALATPGYELLDEKKIKSNKIGKGEDEKF